MKVGKTTRSFKYDLNQIPYNYTGLYLWKFKYNYMELYIHLTVWKILKEMGIPDNLTCLKRNLYAGQEATVRTGHGTIDWFQIGK